jgi:membrane associated rhomboid family serine protease
VGSHCPDCIDEGRKSGGRQVEIPWRRGNKTPAVTAAIVVACIGAFILQNGANAASGIEEFTYRFAEVGVLVHAGEFYRLLTAVFLHHDVIHLGMNMYALWIYGQGLEQREGRARFAAVFVAAGVIGNVASYFVVSGMAVAVGASGGVFGLLGVALVRARQTNSDMRSLLTILAINLAIPFVVPGINVAAHLGGLAAGALYAVASPASARARSWQAWTGTAVLVAIAIAGTVATAFIPPPTPGF